MKAYGKINLSLFILGKRPDGFHDIESIMHEINLADEIKIDRSHGFELIVNDTELSSGKDNLIYKAWKAISDEVGCGLECKITLLKNIPIMAGLAGGSSDCATAMLLLRDYFSLGISDERLAEIGASLGSDVPFFIKGFTQLATGRGTVLEPICDVFFDNILIVNPRVSVSTPQAYEWFHDQKIQNIVDGHILTDLLIKSDYDEFFATSSNQLAPGTVNNVPEVKNILEELHLRGAFAMMSGSGPSVFGIFKKCEDMLAARSYFLERGYIAIVTRSRRRSDER